jgi:hypothetical protein
MFFWGVPKPSLALRPGQAIRYNLPKKNREDFHCKRSSLNSYEKYQKSEVILTQINNNGNSKNQFQLQTKIPICTIIFIYLRNIKYDINHTYLPKLRMLYMILSYIYTS